MPDLFLDLPARPHDEFEQRLVEAYMNAGRTLDDLPYTDEFERLFIEVKPFAGERERKEVFHRLHNLRKAKRLPRLGRSGAAAPPHITPEDEELLSTLVVEQVGSLGQRDQLPYDPRFDRVVESFITRTGRQLAPRDLWRLIAKLAK